jgi:heme/copper-type cytochrome/quinol oxidase subunit 1
MALLMRVELAQPGLQIVNEEVYNQLFTIHGTIMLLLFATPLFVGEPGITTRFIELAARGREGLRLAWLQALVRLA